MPIRSAVAGSLVVLLTGCSLFGSKASSPPPKVVGLALSLGHTEFRSGDPIPVTFSLTNVTGKTLTVNSRFAVNDADAPAAFRELWFEIRDGSGKLAEFQWDTKIGFATSSDFSSLAPGASVGDSIDVASLYGLTDAGEYTLKAFYQNATQGAAITRVESATVRFKIVQSAPTPTPSP